MTNKIWDASELYNAAMDDSTSPFHWMIDGYEDDWSEYTDKEKRETVLDQLAMVADHNSLNLEDMPENEVDLIISQLNNA